MSTRELADAIRGYVHANTQRAYDQLVPLIKQHGKEYLGFCLLHNDRNNPSVRVNPEKATWYCDPCAKGGDIFDLGAVKFNLDVKNDFGKLCSQLAEFYQLSTNGNGAGSVDHGEPISPVGAAWIDADGGPTPTPQYPQRLKGRIKGTPTFYSYLDASGGVLMFTVRIELLEDESKEVLPLTLRKFKNGTVKWTWKDLAKRPIYELYELAHSDKPALILEGEKCVEAAAQLSLSCVPISWRGGSGSVDKVDWAPLRDRPQPIFMWPDCDAAGAKAALAIAKQLGRDDFCIVIPDTNWKKGYDIADAIDAGVTPEQIDAIISSVVLVDEFQKAAFERWSELAKAKADEELPVIQIQAGRRPQIIDEAEAVILKNPEGWGLYRNGELLTHVSAWTKEDRARADDRQAKGQLAVQRPVGVPVLRLPTPGLIDDIFDRAIRWERFDEKKKQLVRTDCPARVSKQYLDRGNWRAPELIGIISAPTVRYDGSIPVEQGYDETAGLLLRSNINWTAPTNLNQDAAREAAQALIKPFEQFPFQNKKVGLSVLVSAILTGLQRRVLPTAPAHAFDANLPGAGKTLTADCISMIVTGTEVPGVSVGTSEETELQKLWASVLIGGDQVVLIDNISRAFNSDSFAAILTKTLYQARILGVSRMAKVFTNVLFLLTGNNLVLLKDMPRRALSARIEVDEENPDQRTGFKIPDLKKYCLDHRQELVGYAHTMIASYIKAGRPLKGKLTPYGSFEHWSDEIRAPIIWAGLSDPCESRETITKNDPEREETRVVFELWYQHFGDKEIHVRDLIDEASVRDTEDGKFIGWRNADLRTALLEVSEKGYDKIDAKRLGWWCRTHLDRPVISEGFKYQLHRGAGDRIGMTWKIIRITKSQK